MDISALRIIVTIVSFLVFLGIMIWVWRNRKSDDFKDAAELPFKED
ncbi:MAG: cbb3-type cytochrome c oxidase subunit 3 [Methylophilaceae bacterium]